MTKLQDQAAVVIGASGGIGAAVARRLEASGRFAVVHALSRAGTGFDLEDEAAIAAAAASVAGGPAPTLVFVASALRWVLLTRATSPVAIVSLQLLHAFTFGA